MTVTLSRPAPILLEESAARWVAARHPRGPDGRFTESFATLMTPGEKGRARQVAAAFTPKRGINTPDGARAYLSGIGPTSPAAATFFAGGHHDVNQALRAGKDDYPGIKAMDDAMRPLPDDILVTRRVPAHMLGDATPEQLVGFKAADAGYTAASVAELPGGPGDVMMHIAVPAGTRAAIHPDSGAVILDRNLELAVLHVAPNQSGGKDMYLAVLTKGDGKDRGDGPDVGAPGGSDGRKPASGDAQASTNVGDAPSAPTGQPISSDSSTGTSFDDRLASAKAGAAARAATTGTLVERDGVSPLPDEQRDAVETYRGDDYFGINWTLRNPEAGDAEYKKIFGVSADRQREQDLIDRMDAAMTDNRLGSDVVALRGLRSGEGLFGDRLNGDLTGMEWREDAYVSTTTDAFTADAFADPKRAEYEGTTPVVMRMIVPKGVGALELSDDDYESEVLLQRGLTMRVVRDNGVDATGRRRLDVEAVPVA